MSTSLTHYPFSLLTWATGLTEAKVQKELAEEEERRLAAGGIALHETTALSFLVLGMELEESQYVTSYPPLQFQGLLTSQAPHSRNGQGAGERGNE